MNVIITGASRGIGRAVALRLGQKGAHVLVNYLKEAAAAEETCRLVAEAGGKAFPVQGDVRAPEALKAIATAAKEQFDGGIDVLVHNAAMGALKPWKEIKTSHWDLTMETSLRPFWLLTKLVDAQLAEGASVIGITSLGSRQFTPGYAAMGAAKAGVEALTRQLAVELAPRVRVNSVCGGPIATDSFDHIPGAPEIIANLGKITPLGRIGAPDDVAGVVAMLTQPESRWITGQVIVADGGLSCV